MIQLPHAANKQHPRAKRLGWLSVKYVKCTAAASKPKQLIPNVKASFTPQLHSKPIESRNKHGTDRNQHLQGVLFIGFTDDRNRTGIFETELKGMLRSLIYSKSRLEPIIVATAGNSSL